MPRFCHAAADLLLLSKRDEMRMSLNPGLNVEIVGRRLLELDVLGRPFAA